MTHTPDSGVDDASTLTEEATPDGAADPADTDPDAPAPSDPAVPDPDPAVPADPDSAIAVDPDSAIAVDVDPAVPAEAVAAPPPVGVAPSAVVDGDGFTITFPIPPTVRVVDVPLTDGQTTQTVIYQAQIEGSFVGFSYADTPDQTAADFDVEAALQDSAVGAADNTGGTVAESTIIDVQGRTAIDYLVTVEGGAIHGVAFFEGSRLYTGQQVAPGGAGGRDLLDALMTTLTLR